MRKGNILKTWLTVLLVFQTSVAVLFAGDPARIGTAAGTQVLIPVGARGLAMGGADLAFTSGLDAIHWNPAGLAAMEGNAAGLFSTMTFFNDIQLNYFAAAFRSRIGSIGVNVRAFDFGDIPVTTQEDMDGASGETFSPTFATIGITYGGNLSDRINIGITAKVIHESIPRAGANAFAIDFGVQYRNLGGIPGLAVGIVARNIGTNLEYTGSGLLTQARDVDSPYDDFRSREAASEQIPSDFELGLSYKFDVGAANHMMVSGIFQNNNFDDDVIRFGGEFAVGNMLFLRGGYSLPLLGDITSEEQDIDISSADRSDDIIHSLTFGGGLHIVVVGMDLTFDYAFRDAKYFNGENVFAIRLGF